MKSRKTKISVACVSAVMLLSISSTIIKAQTVIPTSQPTPLLQATQSPTTPPVTPTMPTVEPWPTGHIVTPPPYDWCNSQGCGYNENYVTHPVGDYAGVSVGKANANQPTTSTQNQKNTTNASIPIPTNPVKYYPKAFPTVAVTPIATPTIFVAPSATPSAKPVLKSSIKPSFFELIWNFLSRIFGEKGHGSRTSYKD